MNRNGLIAAVVAVIVVVVLAFWLFDFGEPTQEAQLPETDIQMDEQMNEPAGEVGTEPGTMREDETGTTGGT